MYKAGDRVLVFRPGQRDPVPGVVEKTSHLEAFVNFGQQGEWVPMAMMMMDPSSVRPKIRLYDMGGYYVSRPADEVPPRYRDNYAKAAPVKKWLADPA